MKKNYFWVGVLTVNKSFEHQLFDIKLKKYSKAGQMAMFYIKDIPPVPLLKREDEFKISIYLENALGNTPQRSIYAEATLSGSNFDFNHAGEQFNVKGEDGEWQFLKAASNRYPSGVTPWFLNEACVKITDNKLKQYANFLSS